MPQWLKRLPLSLRFPVAVAFMIFIVAVTTTQVAIHTSSRQFERQMGQIGQVYLDGLAAALIPSLANGDPATMTTILERSLTVREGIEDLRLAVLDAEGGIVARADRTTSRDPARDPSTTAIDDFTEFVHDRPGMRFDDESRSVWVWRPLPIATPAPESKVAATSMPTLPLTGDSIVANLDVSAFIEERRSLRTKLLLLDLLFSSACAVVGFYVVRKLQRPIALLTEHLQLREGKMPQPVAASLLPRQDPEVASLFTAYNRMVSESRQREAMIGRVMEQERDAILGRMAATLAHEIRNPLGGMVTAIQTVRRFGDDPVARTDALDFIERGVLALQEVTNAALQTHRATTDRPLREQDLRDVGVLAQADASGRDVTVELDVQVPTEMPVPAPEIRQVLLNLMLNAIRASSPGGRVNLRARMEPEHLRLEVEDEGRGLPSELASGLMSGVPPPSTTGGLGVAVIVRLVERLHGRVSVTARSEGGTHISLQVPLGASASADPGANGHGTIA